MTGLTERLDALAREATDATPPGVTSGTTATPAASGLWAELAGIARRQAAQFGDPSRPNERVATVEGWPRGSYINDEPPAEARGGPAARGFVTSRAPFS
jgi:hypothetical protein